MSVTYAGGRKVTVGVCRLQVLSERVDSLTRQIDDVETKSQSLQSTVDKLNIELAHSITQENSQKDQVCLCSIIVLMRRLYVNNTLLFMVFLRFIALY